jgi:hypothetical protein
MSKKLTTKLITMNPMSRVKWVQYQPQFRLEYYINVILTLDWAKITQWLVDMRALLTQYSTADKRALLTKVHC